MFQMPPQTFSIHTKPCNPPANPRPLSNFSYVRLCVYQTIIFGCPSSMTSLWDRISTRLRQFQPSKRSSDQRLLLPNAVQASYYGKLSLYLRRTEETHCCNVPQRQKGLEFQSLRGPTSAYIATTQFYIEGRSQRSGERSNVGRRGISKRRLCHPCYELPKDIFCAE